MRFRRKANPAKRGWTPGMERWDGDDGLAVRVRGGEFDGRSAEVVERGQRWGVIVVRFEDGSEHALEEGSRIELRSGISEDDAAAERRGDLAWDSPPGWSM